MYDRIRARLDGPDLNRCALYDCACTLLLINGRLDRALTMDGALSFHPSAISFQVKNRLADISAELHSLQHLDDQSPVDIVRERVITAHQQGAVILQLLLSHAE
jgi:hypothetical protein